MRTLLSLAATAALLPLTHCQNNHTFVDYNIQANPDLFPQCLAHLNMSFPDCTTGPLSENLVCNRSASPHARASALVSLFTFEELLNNTGNTGLGVPRLRLPNYQVWGEALHGVGRANFEENGETDAEFSWATSFPMPITTMASLNRSLIHAIGSIVSTQLRAFSNAGRGGLDVYSPNINTFRHPVWGRGQETPGEDAHLASVYAYEYITALQGGTDPETLKIIATAKHFAGYDIESWHNHSRLGNDVRITAQELAEYYMLPFLVAARDAKVRSVMCSYNAVNGVPSCASRFFLQVLLRESFSFVPDGYVSGDCGAVYNVWNPHGFAGDEAAASAAAVRAGTDIDCGTSYQWYLDEAFAGELLSRGEIERGVVRLYASLIAAGYFDGDEAVYRDIGWGDVRETDGWDVAYEAAVEGIVLLKNKNSALPLSSEIKSIALIGPWANATTQMQGNYFGPAPYLTSPLAAFEDSNLEIHYALGTNISAPSTSISDPDLASALSAAQSADAILYLGGIDNTLEAEAMDRESIAWPANQLSLITQLSQLGKPLIVTALGGGHVDSSSLKENANVSALLWAGYPGQSGGRAIRDIILGDRAPAGRLVTTQYPAAYAEEFSALDMGLRPNESSGNPGQTYMWYTGDAVFEFGHGLFYTEFQETAVGVNGSDAGAFNIQELVSGAHKGLERVEQGVLLNFTVAVRNEGERGSDYTGIVFANTTAGPEPRPKKWVVGFERVARLEAGEQGVFTVPVMIDSVARTDEKGNRVLYPGKYELALNNERSVVVSFTLEGEEVVLLKWPEDPEAVPDILLSQSASQ
ncbi:glycoside hydrolase superfamily [Aspergillus heterothallicus]